MISRPSPLIFLLLSLVLTVGAWAKGEMVMDPSEQVPVYPKNTFDAELAKQLLEPGTGGIKGSAYFRLKGGLLEKKKAKQFLGAGSKVYLFPATAYCEEVVKLFKKHELPPQEKSMRTIQAERELIALTGKGLPGLPKKKVMCDPEFSKIWKTAVIQDNQGTFTFEHLKPGKYYLQTQPFLVSRWFQYQEQVGENRWETQWSNGATTTSVEPVYETGSGTWYKEVTVGKMITIGKDGDVVEVEVNED